MIEEILLGSSCKKTLVNFARNRLNYCIYCGLEKQLTIDHIIPKTKGGSTTLYNLAPACTECNQAKGNLEALTWWKTTDYWEDAVEKGRVEILNSILNDRRNLAEWLTDLLAENPHFKLKISK